MQDSTIGDKIARVKARQGNEEQNKGWTQTNNEARRICSWAYKLQMSGSFSLPLLLYMIMLSRVSSNSDKQIKFGMD